MQRRTIARRSAARRLTTPSPSSGTLPRAAAISLFAGLALSFAFPEPDLSPLAWVALAPLLVVVPRTTVRGAALCGAAFGVGFFGSLLSWISLVGWLPWALLVLLESSFLVLFAVAWRAVCPSLQTAGRIAAPVALWVAVETLRAVIPWGGFAWGQLAQSQHDQAWLLRLASVAGAIGVTAVVSTANSVLAEGWRAGAFRARRDALRPTLLCLAGVGGLLLLPAAVPLEPVAGPPIEIAVVQGNVPRSWTAQTYEKDLAILDSHVRLSSQLGNGEVDLVVWPESSVGIDLQRDTFVGDQVAAAARRLGAPMIVGGNLDLDADRYKVMAFHISPSGEVVGTYQKTHLVPFGEFVPRREWLGFIPLLEQVPRDAIAGDDATTFDLAGGRVAPVLSFEADFSAVVRRQIAAGGRLLVVGTNTSTWGESWASAQHVAMSQVRAAENRVWVAHAALSGISAIIDPAGRVVSKSGLWEADTLRGTARFAQKETIYTRLGDWVSVVALLGSAAALARAFLFRRSDR